MAIITISRQFGSGGEGIAEVLAEAAGFVLLNKKSLEQYVKEHEVPEIRLEWINESSPRDIEGLENERLAYIEFLKETISGLARDSHVVLLGRGGQFLFSGRDDAVHIKVVAGLEKRSANIQQRFHVDKSNALRLIKEKDAERHDYAMYFHRGDWNSPEVYDLTVNTERVNMLEASRLVLFFLLQREFINQAEYDIAVGKAKEVSEEIEARMISQSESDKREHREKKFANESEEEFAKILDYYKINYLYEPTTFPLKWDNEGNIEKAFSPDFYFPDFDLYIELTTMKQELVTKKNRKLREVKKLYPNVNVKLFYRKDYRKLLEKFGIQSDK